MIGRILESEEALAAPGATVSEFPFGRSFVSAEFPDLPEANRLVVPDPAAADGPRILEEVGRIRAAGRRAASCLVAEPLPAAVEAALRATGAGTRRLLLLSGPARERPPASGPPEGFSLDEARTDRDWIAIETIESELAAEREDPPGLPSRRTARLRGTIAAVGGRYFLATLSGAPAGSAGLFRAGGWARIVGAVERPALRRRGVAAAIFEALAGIGAADGADRVAAIVDDEEEDGPPPAGLDHSGAAFLFEWYEMIRPRVHAPRGGGRP